MSDSSGGLAQSLGLTVQQPGAVAYRPQLPMAAQIPMAAAAPGSMQGYGNASTAPLGVPGYGQANPLMGFGLSGAGTNPASQAAGLPVPMTTVQQMLAQLRQQQGAGLPAAPGQSFGDSGGGGGGNNSLLAAGALAALAFA